MRTQQQQQQQQAEQIINLIDEHFNNFNVMSESDYNSILHYVDYVVNYVDFNSEELK